MVETDESTLTVFQICLVLGITMQKSCDHTELLKSPGQSWQKPEVGS